MKKANRCNSENLKRNEVEVPVATLIESGGRFSSSFAWHFIISSGSNFRENLIVLLDFKTTISNSILKNDRATTMFTFKTILSSEIRLILC